MVLECPHCRSDLDYMGADGEPRNLMHTVRCNACARLGVGRTVRDAVCDLGPNAQGSVVVISSNSPTGNVRRGNRGKQHGILASRFLGKQSHKRIAHIINPGKDREEK